MSIFKKIALIFVVLPTTKRMDVRMVAVLYRPIYYHILTYILMIYYHICFSVYGLLHRHDTDSISSAD